MPVPSPFRRSVTGKVSIVAHRGLSAEEPENTMRSFRRAVAVGCDLVELDVHRTRDGHVVVIHDDTVDRTTDGTGHVRDLSLAEIRALDAGKGERVPTFDEVCAWAAGAAVTLSVELKQAAPVGGRPRDPDLAAGVLVWLRRHGLLERCLVHSFDHPSISQVRRIAPQVAAAVSYGGGTFVDPLVLGRSVDASGIHPWWAWVSRELCDAAHTLGLHVHGWGIPQGMRREDVVLLVAAGVDSLDANDPRELRAILDSL
jgi:glycerophosphoryl diester phosphodiesterase